MTLEALRERVLYQTNNDADDLDDFEPHITDYLNIGYNLLLYAYSHRHVGADDAPPLADPADEPQVPERYQSAIADWATWMIYRNGNLQKQQRGQQFRYAAEQVFAEARAGVNGPRNFINVP
jgi:hypothetical protein